MEAILVQFNSCFLVNIRRLASKKRKMGKLAYLLGGAEEPKERISVQGIIKDVKLYINALGWLTMAFRFENAKRSWQIMHLNEDYYQEILLWFLQKGAELAGHEEEIVLGNPGRNTVSFDGGKTFAPIYELCDDTKMLQSFKGRSLNVKSSEYLQDGAVSLDGGKTWFDIDARKKELDKSFFESGGRIDMVLL